MLIIWIGWLVCLIAVVVGSCLVVCLLVLLLLVSFDCLLCCGFGGLCCGFLLFAWLCDFGLVYCLLFVGFVLRVGYLVC